MDFVKLLLSTYLVILSTILLTYPWLRFLFFVFRRRPEIEPEAIRRYSIYSLAHLVGLIVGIVLAVQVLFPFCIGIFVTGFQNVLIPRSQTHLVETRQAVQMLPAGDEQFESRRDEALLELDEVGNIFISSELDLLASDLDSLFSLVLPGISWVVIIVVLCYLLLPFLVLGGWLRGVFYMLLVAVSFALENILQQISPELFRLPPSSPAAIVIIAICIFSSALFLDWVFETWTEPKKACLGCGRMVEERDSYCPACGLVQV